jgi:hypothetical protein
MFNVSLSTNISAISWQSVLLVEETGEPGENHRPVTSYRVWCSIFYSKLVNCILLRSLLVFVKGRRTCGSGERNVNIWIDFRKSPRFSLTSPLSQEREKSSRPVFTKKNTDLKRLTGRLKLHFLTEIGRLHWNQGKEVAHFAWFGEPWVTVFHCDSMRPVFSVRNIMLVFVINELYCIYKAYKLL